MASSTAVMAQVFVGDADDMVDKLIAACQMLPTAVDPGAGMARELVPYFDEGVEADKPATTPKTPRVVAIPAKARKHASSQRRGKSQSQVATTQQAGSDSETVHSGSGSSRSVSPTPPMIRGTFFAGPSITSPSPGMLPIPSTLLGDAGVRPPNVDASVLELKRLLMGPRKL